MRTLKINPNKIKKQEIGTISDFLKRGEVIVYPTDTIYGIGCLATDKKAVMRVYDIKKKDRNKPLLILVGSLSMAKKYCRIGKKQEALLEKVWPGPVSVILESRGFLPEELAGGQAAAGIGVRLPKNGFLIKMIKAAGAPIVSTSANISGEKPIYDPKDLSGYFKKEKPDLVVDGGMLKGKASSLVDLRDVNNIRILRR